MCVCVVVAGRDGPTALITYELHKQARVAVEKINGSSRGGLLVVMEFLSATFGNSSLRPVIVERPE